MNDLGMLWYDDDKKRPIDEKVARAAEYYRAKFGVSPTVVWVNPAMLNGDAPASVAGVKVEARRTVLKNHLWLGVIEAPVEPENNTELRQVVEG